MAAGGLYAQNYDFKAGPVVFNLSGLAGLVFNSNVHLSADRPESDIYGALGLNLEANWEITPYNSLNIAVVAEYRHYFAHPEYSSDRNFLHLSPSTRVAFNLKVGEIGVLLSDQVSFSADPSEVRVINRENGQADREFVVYGRFENTAQARAEWAMNPSWRFDLTLQRNDLIPLDSFYESLERTEHLVRLGVVHPVAANFTAGAFVALANNQYNRRWQNETNSFAYGLFANWSVTKQITIEGQLGITQSETTYSGYNQEPQDNSTWFGHLTWEHAVNRKFSYTAGYRRQQNYGYVSNYIYTNTWALGFHYAVIQRGRLQGKVYWQDGRESGGRIAERYERFSAEVGLEYNQSRRTRWRCFYTFSTRDSNLAQRDYDQHQLGIYIFYDF